MFVQSVRSRQDSPVCEDRTSLPAQGVRDPPNRRLRICPIARASENSCSAPQYQTRGSTAPPLARQSLRPPRSEEHTSELQSQSNIVCRLLLEKKKKRELCYSTCKI